MHPFLLNELAHINQRHLAAINSDEGAGQQELQQI